MSLFCLLLPNFAQFLLGDCINKKNKIKKHKHSYIFEVALWQNVERFKLCDCGFVCSDHKPAEICPHSHEVRSETSSNPSSPEICPNKERSPGSYNLIYFFFKYIKIQLCSRVILTTCLVLCCSSINRPFIKHKECSSGSSCRPNISRSSSSTSSFSSTTGETEALEELETVGRTFISPRVDVEHSGN